MGGTSQDEQIYCVHGLRTSNRLSKIPCPKFFSDQYIDYWKDSHEREILSCYRGPSGSFRPQWEALSRRGLISSNDVEKLDQQTTPTNHRGISMSPGLAIQYTWSRAEAEVLDARGAFAKEVRRRIREATETWGETPRFCDQPGARSNAPADA